MFYIPGIFGSISDVDTWGEMKLRSFCHELWISKFELKNQVLQGIKIFLKCFIRYPEESNNVVKKILSICFTYCQ